MLDELVGENRYADGLPGYGHQQTQRRYEQDGPAVEEGQAVYRERPAGIGGKLWQGVFPLHHETRGSSNHSLTTGCSGHYGPPCQPNALLDVGQKFPAILPISAGLLLLGEFALWNLN